MVHPHGYWQEAEVTLHGTLWGGSCNGNWFSPEWVREREREKERNVFLDLVSEVIYHYFGHILFIGTESLSIRRGELIYTCWVEEYEQILDRFLDTTTQYKQKPGWKNLRGGIQRPGVGQGPPEMAAGARQHTCVCSQGSVLMLVPDGCYHPDDNDSFHFLFVWRKISFYASQAVYGSFYLFTHSYGTQGMITAIQTVEC